MLSGTLHRTHAHTHTGNFLSLFNTWMYPGTHTRKPWDTLLDPVLSFHYVDLGDQTQVFRLGSKCLNPMSHLTSPCSVFRDRGAGRVCSCWQGFSATPSISLKNPSAPRSTMEGNINLCLFHLAWLMVQKTEAPGKNDMVRVLQFRAERTPAFLVISLSII